MWINKKDVHIPEAEQESAELVGHFVKDAQPPFVHAFWHVERVTDPKDDRINMIMSKEETATSYKLPVMKNKRKVNQNDVLVLLVQAAPKVAADAPSQPKPTANNWPAEKQRKA